MAVGDSLSLMSSVLNSWSTVLRTGEFEKSQWKIKFKEVMKVVDGGGEVEWCAKP